MLRWITYHNPSLKRTWKMATVRVDRSELGLVTLGELKDGDYAEIKEIGLGMPANWIGLVINKSRDFGLVWVPDLLRCSANNTQITKLQLVTQDDQIVIKTDTRLLDRVVDSILPT